MKEKGQQQNPLFFREILLQEKANKYYGFFLIRYADSVQCPQ